MKKTLSLLNLAWLTILSILCVLLVLYPYNPYDSASLGTFHSKIDQATNLEELKTLAHQITLLLSHNKQSGSTNLLVLLALIATFAANYFLIQRMTNTGEKDREQGEKGTRY